MERKTEYFEGEFMEQNVVERTIETEIDTKNRKKCDGQVRMVEIQRGIYIYGC